LTQQIDTSPQRLDSPLTSLIGGMLDRHGPGLYGVTGPAGAGKSFAAADVSRTTGVTVYSADYRFIGNSLERRMLLIRKQMKSIDDYRDSANQFNWWDWGAILSDVEDLLRGSDVSLTAAYDRSSGNAGGDVHLPATDRIIIEGALLGPHYLATKIKKVFFLWADPAVRFQRLLLKDSGRRSFGEICARFLITEYSETLYYQNLFKWIGDRIVFVDSLTGLPCGQPALATDLFVPLRASEPADQALLKP
jgi:cytidylate kinase